MSNLYINYLCVYNNRKYSQFFKLLASLSGILAPVNLVSSLSCLHFYLEYMPVYICIRHYSQKFFREQVYKTGIFEKCLEKWEEFVMTFLLSCVYRRSYVYSMSLLHLFIWETSWSSQPMNTTPTTYPSQKRRGLHKLD